MSAALRVLIVDDEPPARARLCALVREMPGAEVVGEAGDGEQALEAVSRLAPDVILLDIRMPGMDGLEAARHLRGLSEGAAPAVIFTTAYGDHALEAFEARAIDYLLKPIRRHRLHEALGRLAGRSALEAAAVRVHIEQARAEHGGARTHLSARIGEKLELVAVSEVRFLRADRKYVTAVHPGGELVLNESLVGLEAELGERFLRVHRNALVAPAHVHRLRRLRTGGYRLELAGVEDTVEVSRRMLRAVRARLRSGPGQ